VDSAREPGSPGLLFGAGSRLLSRPRPRVRPLRGGHEVGQPVDLRVEWEVNRVSVLRDEREVPNVRSSGWSRGPPGHGSSGSLIGVTLRRWPSEPGSRSCEGRLVLRDWRSPERPRAREGRSRSLGIPVCRTRFGTCRVCAGFASAVRRGLVERTCRLRVVRPGSQRRWDTGSCGHHFMETTADGAWRWVGDHRARLWEQDIRIQRPASAGSGVAASCRGTGSVRRDGLGTRGVRSSRVGRVTTRWQLFVWTAAPGTLCWKVSGGWSPRRVGYPHPGKAVAVWRGNARRGMAPRGDRLLEREKL
jgi:hypothetical protein